MLLFFILPIIHCELKKITILGTNDIHGRLTPILSKKSDDLTINLGGLSLLSSYIKVKFLK
jgi:2',3'-cyclic-nucleotide 2'-phosphodiesterase (5'-nucleotidase family)